MKVWLDNYFGFTKREYNGLLVLTAMLLFVSVLPYVYELIYTSKSTISTNEQTSLNNLVVVNEQQKNNYTKIRAQIEDNEAITATSLFKFDPNQINQQQWQLLGLSAKQAQSIINYRNKGGKFYKPEDLQKMYTISPAKYKQLVPFIDIQSNANSYNKPAYTEKSAFGKKELIIVEINSADTVQLTEIKGIGPANITQININTADFEELKNHPYLKYKQINAIIQYRKQHGKYNSIEDLKKVIILTPQIIQSIAPYLSF